MLDGNDDDTWALHLVVRIEKDAPPPRADAYRAAAGAVLELLHDERAATDWAGPLAAWRSRRIRKLVRRARGASWRALEELDGVEYWCGDAQVRAFPPTTRAGLPKLLDRLQVTGTDLPKPEPPARPPVGGVPVVLWLNPDVAASSGKLMAQVGHAAQLMDEHLQRADPQRWAAWRADQFQLAVCRATQPVWRQLVTTAPVTVADAGFTEVAPGTVTTAATTGTAW